VDPLLTIMGRKEGRSLRIALIHVMQESNTFNPLPTTLADFANVALLEGELMLSRVDPNGPTAGCIDVLSSSEFEIEVVPILRADAQSGGRISSETLSEFCRIIQLGLGDGTEFDGLMVFLHGAASAEGFDDVEGEILSAIRQVVNRSVPIALMLDHHANVTHKMMDQVDVLMAFRTQPHDPYETARDLTKIALETFSKKISPTMAWRKIPMITHQEQFLTASGPMKEWFDIARRFEDEGKALSISLFPMQPWLDVNEAGWSVVVVTDNNQIAAQEIAVELANHAWSKREHFMVLENMAVNDAIAFADDPKQGKVLLSDTGDSVLGGSSGDSTVILKALLEREMQHTALVPVTDPQAARQLASSQIGEIVTLNLGGWSNSFYSPIQVTGKVKAIREGAVFLQGLPQGSVDMGKSVILEAGNVLILVTEFSGVGGIHPDVYRHFDIEPNDFKMFVMKTASNFQYMRDIATKFVRVASPGPTQSDVQSLPWSRIPRPMFPLDILEGWSA
jgi:microcystin degradation protein MlrC